MKNLIILFIITLFSLQSQAQNWIEPVDISHMGGLNHEPSFCIGPNGHIHCVWSQWYNVNYGIIFYSKSIDNGYSWSIAENISQNVEGSAKLPHIVSDSDNNVHLTYDFDWGYKRIQYRMFNGMSWSETINLAQAMPYSKSNKIFVDHNDRVYCYWYSGPCFYRYMENEIWSDILCSYDSIGYYGFNNCVIDLENNLHWIGVHSVESQKESVTKATYFYYDYENDQWGDFVDFGEGRSLRGTDIDIDQDEKLHIVWQEFIDQGPDPSLSITNYNFQDENGTWSAPEYLGEAFGNQRIIIDNHNQPNIFHFEIFDDSANIVHLYRYNSNWTSSIITIEKHPGDFEVLEANDQIYMVLQEYQNDDPPYTAEIKFTKTDLIDEINDGEQVDDFNISPNPSSHHINISFQLNSAEKVSIMVYNLQGELIKTLLNESKPSGNHQLIWNAKDEYGREVKSGLYLVCLQTDHHVQTQRVEYMR